MTLVGIYNLSESPKKSNKKIIFNIQTSLLVITVLFVSFLNIQDRDKYNYRDLDNEFLNYNLKEVNIKFGNIYTNESTFTYMYNLQNCIENLSNNNVHIFPDNSVLYFILDIHNPLPINWHEGIREETALDNIKTFEKIQELNSEDFPFYIVLQDNYAAFLKDSNDEDLNVFSGIEKFSNSDKKNIIETYKNLLNHESVVCKNYEVLKVVGKK